MWCWGLGLLATDIAVVIGLQLVGKRRRFLAADRIGAIAAIFAINVFGVLGAYFLDRSGCKSNPNLGCLLNQNQGAIAFGALIVAALTVYVGARMKQDGERRSNARRHAEAAEALCDAAEELLDNIQHFAYEIDESDRFLSFPATTFQETINLLTSGALSHFHPRLKFHVSTIQRLLTHNRAVLSSAAEFDDSLRIFLAIGPHWHCLPFDAAALERFAKPEERPVVRR